MSSPIHKPRFYKVQSQFFPKVEIPICKCKVEKELQESTFIFTILHLRNFFVLILKSSL